MGKDDHFLTTEEVLGYLHINVRTIYRLVHAGKIPAFRVGRQWRFRTEDIQAWLAAQQAHGYRASDHTPRILVVDDDLAVRTMLAEALATAPYEVDTVPDGPTALDRLGASEYDLVITDLKMPGMDGLSVIRAVRKLSPYLPIVIITGYSTEASAIEAINLGVQGYLLKPFRVPRILEVTAKALGEPAPLALEA